MVVSGAILLVLASGIGLIAVVGGRAKNLSRMQMDFVSRVSHELRTPMSVIRSAAHNLEKGVVLDQKDVQEYGKLLGDEGLRLSQMVDQILMFSCMESGRTKFDKQPATVADIVKRSLSTMSSAIEQAGADVTADLGAGLPKVNVDTPAVAHCIDNLVSNALKYGRSDAGVKIQIRATREGDDVVLSVSDKGPG